MENKTQDDKDHPFYDDNYNFCVVTKAIISRFRIEGVHYLPQSSPSSEHYQKNPHRHVFHFEVTVNAFEDEDRALNGVAIARMCRNKFYDILSTESIFDFGEKQALDIAHWLGKALFEALEGRGVRVQVMEDGENGAVVSFGVFG